MGWGTDPVVAPEPTTQKPAQSGWGKDPVLSESEKETAAPQESEAGKFVRGLGGVAEFGARTVAGIPLMIGGGLAGIAQGAYNIGAEAVGAQPGMPAGDRVQQVQGALGPAKTETARGIEYGVGKVLGPAQEFVRAPGQMIAEAGAPATGAIVSALPETALTLLAPEARGALASAGRAAVRGGARTLGAMPVPPVGAAVPGGAPVNPQLAAQQWVSKNTNLTWDQIPERLRTILTNVAQDATQLGKLDPKSLERQATLERAGITKATKGQLTREPLQQRTEQLARASEGGEPLRQMDLENNRILAENVKALAKGAQAEGPVQVGQSVQTVLRDRLAAAKKNVSRLYKQAKLDGELQGPVDIQPLLDFVDTNIAPQSVGWLKNAIEAIKARNTTKVGGTEVTETRPVTLEQIEEAIRKEAVRQSRSADGSVRFQAGEAIKIIDDMTAGSGGTSFKAARAARRAMGEEFENTQAVAQLVKNRKMSQDRAVKLEDTWRRTVINGGLEDLKKVYTSLRRGGPAGRQAWRDLRGATADYILGKATGGGPLGLKTAAGDLNVTWDGLRRAVQDIGPEKMEFLFGKVGAKRMNDIVEAAQILKTEAPTGVKGSPTLDKLVTLLGSFGAAGDLVSGVLKVVKKGAEIGKSSRDVTAAMQSPLEAAQAGMQRSQTLQSVGRGSAVGGLTLGGMRPNETPP
jgi:hypothetical protein